LRGSGRRSCAWVCVVQMTSMLRDEDRMSKYEVAIRVAIGEFIEATGRRPVVLDIGAGTGLLSMFAARAGAQKVYVTRGGGWSVCFWLCACAWTCKNPLR
jgi:ribosomal protein L11 methylase PrmA